MNRIIMWLPYTMTTYNQDHQSIKDHQSIISFSQVNSTASSNINDHGCCSNHPNWGGCVSLKVLTEESLNEGRGRIYMLSVLGYGYVGYLKGPISYFR